MNRSWFFGESGNGRLLWGSRKQDCLILFRTNEGRSQKLDMRKLKGELFVFTAWNNPALLEEDKRPKQNAKGRMTDDHSTENDQICLSAVRKTAPTVCTISMILECRFAVLTFPHLRRRRSH